MRTARSLADLSRTHSWLMSGTPSGNSVDDLLGQLMFLGVCPYADRGSEGDAFWEREVSSRWRRHDPDALEVVHDLVRCRVSTPVTSGLWPFLPLPLGCRPRGHGIDTRANSLGRS